MGIEATSSATSTVGASTTSASADAAYKTGLDYDTFLKLLIAQMQNQDPTDPMDSTEQIAQLATFSQVEQTIQTNANLETLIQSSKLTEASAIIGKTVTSADGSVKGVVQQVKIMSDDTVVVLEDGSELSMVAGTIVENTTLE